MKIIQVITCIYLFAVASLSHADDWSRVVGFTASTGFVTNEDGGFANLNGVMLIYNGGVEFKVINDDPYVDMYMGIGAMDLLQLQLGLGNEGASFKIRSDLKKPSQFFEFKRRAGYSVLENILITLCYERYFSADIDDLFLVGAGFWF